MVHPKAFSDRPLQKLPAFLALPLRWAEYLPIEDVFGLTIEKLFAVESTELERLAFEGHEQQFNPLRAPVPLWSLTVAYVAARIGRIDEHQQLEVIASQFCGTPVFVDAHGEKWDVARFRVALDEDGFIPLDYEQLLIAWNNLMTGAN